MPIGSMSEILSHVATKFSIICPQWSQMAIEVSVFVQINIETRGVDHVPYAHLVTIQSYYQHKCYNLQLSKLLTRHSLNHYLESKNFIFSSRSFLYDRGGQTAAHELHTALLYESAAHKKF